MTPKKQAEIGARIAAYRDAYRAANGKPISAWYEAGWYFVDDTLDHPGKYRASTMDRMTERLTERANKSLRIADWNCK